MSLVINILKTITIYTIALEEAIELLNTITQV